MRARFDAQTGFKLPASGRLELPDTIWKDPRQFDENADCMCPDGEPDSCPAP